MRYGITQCYLPPGIGDFPAFTPAEAGTRFSDPGQYNCYVVYQRNTVTYLVNNRVVSWLGIEPVTESR